MLEVSHLCPPPIKSGIVLKNTYFKLIKDTIQTTLVNKLNVEIRGSAVQRGGIVEVLLVGCGGNAKFEEAKVLLDKTVKLAEENWGDIQLNSSSSMKGDQTINLEDSACCEEIILDDALVESKGNTKKSNSEIVCEGKSSDGLCIVVMDTEGGSASINTQFPEAIYNKKKINTKTNVICSNANSTNEINVNFSDNSLNYANTSNDLQQELIIPLQSKESGIKINKPEKETIFLQDDTILISSDSDSDGEIKIEKVIKKLSSSPKKKKKKLRTLSDERSPIQTLPPPIVSARKSPVRAPTPKTKTTKRKSKDSMSPWQRKAKISKKKRFSDVTSSSTGGPALLINNVHLQGAECKSSGIIQDPSTSNQSIPQQCAAGTKFKNGVNLSFDSNFASSSTDESIKKVGLRPIIIDGNNLGRRSRTFNLKDVETCIKYFRERNHKVIAFLPRHSQGFVQPDERARMYKLEEEKVLCFTPSRKMPNGKQCAAYDDRFIVQTATELGGVIVSNDNFRDVMAENAKWQETVEKRLLMYTWVGDMLMFPIDPLGRGGPHLQEFLRFPKEGE